MKLPDIMKLVVLAISAGTRVLNAFSSSSTTTGQSNFRRRTPNGVRSTATSPARSNRLKRR